MSNINKVSERELFNVLGVLRLNPDIIGVLETAISLIKTGDISEEKFYSIVDLERILRDTEEQLEECYDYSDILQKRLT